MICAAGALWWGWRADVAPDPGQVALTVQPALADVAPSTIAPRTGAINSSAPEDPAQPTDQPARSSIPTAMTPPALPSTPATSVPLSPLAALVGPAGSAIPPVLEPRARPTALVIRDLDVFAPVRPVGLEDDGAMEIPDETEIGWYRYGGAPGGPGATVLAAHITWNRTLGPFYQLGRAEPGERVEVVLDDGSTRVYEIVERTVFDKDALPRWRIWRNTGPESLVLITCGGSYNPEIRRYRQNIVVFAVPVEQLDPTSGATP